MTILDALEAAERSATPGPWRHVGATVAGHPVDAVYGGQDGKWNITRYPRPNDAALITLLRNHAADLIAVARAAQEWPKPGEDGWIHVHSALAPLLRERES